jgi:pimeloyl-ACP methyl ester carboxylesterase
MAGSNGNGANGNGGGEKSPMLLLHGFTGTPVMWEPLLPYLEQHHECVAIPLPGHHGGPPFTDPGDNIVHTYVDAVEAEMDALGWEKAHIVGNSLGGWLALALAGRGRALTTVAIAPAGGWELHSAETRRAQRLFKAIQFQLAAFGPIPRLLSERPRGRMITMRDAVAYPQRLPGRLAVQWIDAASDTPAWRLLLEHSPGVNAENTCEPHDSPVRIAWGTRDRILPFNRYSPGWKKLLPDAEWITLEGLGHVPMSDDPELISRTILEVSAAPAPEVAGPN